MDRRILNYLQSEGLASLMNATKWREVATHLQGIEQGRLPVRVKYLLDEEPSGYACLDWEWVRFGDTSIIEWLEIDPVIRTFRGRLVPDKAEDFSDAVELALRTVGAPFSVEGRCFRIWGHMRPGTCLIPQERSRIK